MDPNMAAELAIARHAELRRTAESRRTTRPAAARRRAQPASRSLSRSVFETTQGLRQRVAQAIAPASQRPSTLEPCC